jgi:hypothetical protein
MVEKHALLIKYCCVHISTWKQLGRIMPKRAHSVAAEAAARMEKKLTPAGLVE